MPANLENLAVATGLERSVFIPIPKKGNAKECSNYCTIVLISQASKVMLKIIYIYIKPYIYIPLYIYHIIYIIYIIQNYIYIYIYYTMDLLILTFSHSKMCLRSIQAVVSTVGFFSLILCHGIYVPYSLFNHSSIS